jgi:hypothetical protein
VQFIDDDGGAHTEPSPDATANIALANAADDAAAESESCPDADVHVLRNRDRRARPTGCRSHRTRRS